MTAHRWSLALLLPLAVGAAEPSRLLQLGRQAARDGAWTRAETLLEQAEVDATRFDDQPLLLSARLARVDLRLLAGEADSARDLFPTSPGAVQAADSVAWLLTRARLDLPGSESLSGRALDAARALPRRQRSLLVATLLTRARQSADTLESRTLLREARRKAHGLQKSAVLLEEARLRLRRGEPVPATEAAAEAAEAYRSARDVPGLLGALPVLARAREAAGDRDGARSAWNSLERVASGASLARPTLEALCALDRLGDPDALPRARRILALAGLPPSSLPAWGAALR